MANLATKDFFQQDAVKKKFEELLGKRAPQFITSVLQVVSNNKLLQNADATSIYHAACMAATLDLPINQNLGYAWIVPYSGAAQFQMGWKGYVQLAQRTGQYERINVLPVYQNQFKDYNPLTEALNADFTQKPDGKIVGYCAYFKMLNGFEKTVYKSEEEILAHGKKYSKSFKSGPWQTETDKMCMKTLLKETLSKYGMLSVEIQKAVAADQAVIKDAETVDVQYIDAAEAETKEEERIRLMIDDCKTIDELKTLYKQVPDSLLDYAQAKQSELEAELTNA